MGQEKWIIYKNVEHKKSCTKDDEPPQSPQKLVLIRRQYDAFFVCDNSIKVDGAWMGCFTLQHIHQTSPPIPIITKFPLWK